MPNISSKYKNKTVVAYLTLFLFFALVPFLVINFSNATLHELKLKPGDPSYIRKAKEEDAFPLIYRSIRDAAGFEMTELSDLNAGRNFIQNSNGSFFVVGGDDIWLFEFETPSQAKTASEGFFSHGYKFREPTTQSVTTLLFRTNPNFFLNDRSLVIHTGESEEVAKMLSTVVGGKFEPAN